MVYGKSGCKIQMREMRGEVIVTRGGNGTVCCDQPMEIKK
jgi:hypothetical protein